MERPCFLVVDREYPGSISARKLVIETAKFNVITAYDSDEALDSLKRFPRVDGVVVNADMDDHDACAKLIGKLRAIVPAINVIVISARDYPSSNKNEFYVDSLNPKKLLECLQSIKKEATAEILARDERITQ